MLMNCGKYFLGSSPFLWTTGLLVMVSTEIFYGNYDITTNGQEHGWSLGEISDKLLSSQSKLLVCFLMEDKENLMLHL